MVGKVQHVLLFLRQWVQDFVKPLRVQDEVTSGAGQGAFTSTLHVYIKFFGYFQKGVSYFSLDCVYVPVSVSKDDRYTTERWEERYI